MGYNPNTVYCNLAEFEKVGLATIFAFNSLEREKAKEESLVDLKLGRLGDSGKGSSQSFRDQTASLMDPFSSSAGSSKRARPPSSAGQVVSCLVDGCKADLSKCRDYHRRHKVCEMHSKTPRVTIGGHEQRFCQQCSRFHSLGEFDEGKRSCRKRLEGHNRRRRKPQPEPLPVNPGNFLPASQVATLWLRCAMPYNPMLNCAGSRFSPFSSQPMIPATSVMNSTWSGSVKSESNPTLYSSSVSSSFSNAYRGRQFPFLEVPEPPVISGASTAGHDGSSSSNNSWSDRALSLLSSSPAETPDMGLSRVIHPSQTNADRPTLSGLQFNGFAPYAASHDLGFQGQPAANMRNSNILCQDVFQSGSDGSSTSAGHQTLSFSWE